MCVMHACVCACVSCVCVCLSWLYLDDCVDCPGTRVFAFKNSHCSLRDRFITQRWVTQKDSTVSVCEKFLVMKKKTEYVRDIHKTLISGLISWPTEVWSSPDASYTDPAMVLGSPLPFKSLTHALSTDSFK